MLAELTLAQKLSRLRGSRSLSEVAREAGTTASTLCRMEQGVHDRARAPQSSTLRGETLRRLARYYQMIPQYFTSDLRTYMQAWAEAALANPVLDTPAARLRRLAEELEQRYAVTLADLARVLAIDEADLADYLKGVVPLGDKAIAALEDATGIPATWVVNCPAAAPWEAQEYERPVALAMSTGVPPDVLEELVHDWLSKKRTKS